MDSDGRERWRLEGYLPKDDFNAFLELGLGRVAFMRKDWAAAERHFQNVLTGIQSRNLLEAVYYRGVSRYSLSHDAAELASTAGRLNTEFQGNEWQLRSLPWLGERSDSNAG